MRLQLLAFSGMQQRSPASLLAETPVANLREANNLDPSEFPLLVPRKTLRYIHEDASGNIIWPFRKPAD